MYIDRVVEEGLDRLLDFFLHNQTQLNYTLKCSHVQHINRKKKLEKSLIMPLNAAMCNVKINELNSLCDFFLLVESFCMIFYFCVL